MMSGPARIHNDTRQSLNTQRNHEHGAPIVSHNMHKASTLNPKTVFNKAQICLEHQRIIAKIILPVMQESAYDYSKLHLFRFFPSSSTRRSSKDARQWAYFIRDYGDAEFASTPIDSIANIQNLHNACSPMSNAEFKDHLIRIASWLLVLSPEQSLKARFDRLKKLVEDYVNKTEGLLAEYFQGENAIVQEHFARRDKLGSDFGGQTTPGHNASLKNINVNTNNPDSGHHDKLFEPEINKVWAAHTNALIKIDQEEALALSLLRNSMIENLDRRIFKFASQLDKVDKRNISIAPARPADIQPAGGFNNVPNNRFSVHRNRTSMSVLSNAETVVDESGGHGRPSRPNSLYHARESQPPVLPQTMVSHHSHPGPCTVCLCTLNVTILECKNFYHEAKNEILELKALVRDLKSDIESVKHLRDNKKEFKDMKNDLGDNKRSIDQMSRGVESIVVNTKELKNMMQELMKEVVDEMTANKNKTQIETVKDNLIEKSG